MLPWLPWTHRIPFFAGLVSDEEARGSRSDEGVGTPVSPPQQDDLDPRPEVLELLKTLKASLGSLNELLEESTSHWGYEDAVYRFYHQSFKVYAIQQTTDTIVEALQSLAPDRKLNSWFLQIVEEGTGVVFEPAHNPQWLTVTRRCLRRSSTRGTSSRWPFVMGRSSRPRRA